MQKNITCDVTLDRQMVNARFQAPGRKGVSKCVDVDICYTCSFLFFLIMTVKGFGAKSRVVLLGNTKAFSE